MRPKSWQSTVDKVRLTFPNLVVDRLVRSLAWDDLSRGLGNVGLGTLDLSSNELRDWAGEYYPGYPRTFGDFRHKKLIEFFISFKILSPDGGHVFMDAAGGANSYLAKLPCKRKVLQDIRVPDSTRAVLGPGVDYIEGDAGSIPLPDGSVDRISCHHSFEHFQGDSDSSFIGEVQRLLAVGGKCCIVPLFLANRYAEITDRVSLGFKFDPASRRVIDPTALIPGGEYSGNYARVYSVEALQRRVIRGLDLSRFSVTILSVTLDGELVPDMSLDCHRIVTAVNYPYRALVLHRFSD
jgi:hypothetical protein